MTEVTAVPLRPVGKGGVAALWIGVAVLIGAGIGGAVWASDAPRRLEAPSPALTKLPADAFMAANGQRGGVVTTPSGLQYTIISAGAGDKPKAGDAAQIEYRGTLVDGTEFDSSRPGQPVTLPIGQVVPGFAEALMLMSRGATYRVWIPPQLGYGDTPVGPIPGNSVLVFDVVMHDFGAPQQPQQPQQGQPDPAQQSQAPQAQPQQ
jgi:FKBP-type peptidyl-prolyl cis-trans isomerase FkpA